MGKERAFQAGTACALTDCPSLPQLWHFNRNTKVPGIEEAFQDTRTLMAKAENLSLFSRWTKTTWVVLQ